MNKIGVSACLLGQNVRYDGKNKFIDLERHFDPKIYQLVAICPEVEMGLSIPRQPIQIINDGDIKLVQVSNHQIDFTQQMHSWFKENSERISEFSGFILKSKSPSCGNQSTQHYHIEGNRLEISDGFFVCLLKKYNPTIVFIDEIGLTMPETIRCFIKNLSSY